MFNFFFFIENVRKSLFFVVKRIYFVMDYLEGVGICNGGLVGKWRVVKGLKKKVKKLKFCVIE